MRLGLQNGEPTYVSEGGEVKWLSLLREEKMACWRGKMGCGVGWPSYPKTFFSMGDSGKKGRQGEGGWIG